MSDTTFDPAALLYGNLDKSPADFAAAMSPAASKPPANAALLPDPDDNAGTDPADPVPAADPADSGQYPLEPDSAVTPPEPPPGQEAAPQGEPAQTPPADPAQAPSAQEPVDLAPVFTQALQDYNAAAQAAQEAAQKLADLQNNAEGIVEFTPEVAEAMQAKMKAEAAAERAFDEIGDDSITVAINTFPELADDNHPATIAVKNILAANPELATRSPTAVAELSVKIASDIRAKSKPPAQPVSQPQPAPGPVPAKTAAPASAMSSHAQAQRPAPGQPTTPDIVAQVKAAAQEGGLGNLFASVLGKANTSGVRMS